MRALHTLPVLGLALSWTTPAPAQSVLYELHPASDFIEGCYEPCDCLLELFEDLSGSFELELIGPGADWFTHYDVLNLNWTIGTPDGLRHVTGSGTYAVGGQLALSQRMQLDLSIDGAPLEHFDSGIVPGGYSFPVIDLAIAMNGFYCFDRVFDLNAAPLSIGPTYCTSAPNSVGPGANIGAVGSPVVADDAFGLVAQGTPPGMFGVFFFASNATQIPFGDGFLCATGNLFRLSPPLTSDPAGNLFRGVDLGAPPGTGNLVPGSTWFFQFWYRDPSGGPAGFNLTDGVSVTFL